MFNALGKEAVGLLLDHLPEQVPPLAGRYRVQAFFNTPLQTFYGAIQSQLPHGAGSVQGNVNAGWFTDDLGIGNCILNIVGNLVGLANAVTQFLPRLGLDTGGSGA